MAKKPEQLETRATRQSLRKLATDLLEQFAKEKSVLTNYYGILGMGKEHLLRQALIPLLDSNQIQHDEIVDIRESPPVTEVLAVSQKIAEWVHQAILNSKEKIASDMNGLERVYFNLRGQLSERKDKQPFAVLINNINNLPFDDLDWFQSVVLETLVSSLGSIVVVTSQNELNWHTWEMRNKCRSEKLPVFSEEDIFDLCESRPLAQKIRELSAGHPGTVQAMLKEAGEKKSLSSFTEEDVNVLEQELFGALKKEIDASLNFRGKNEWLGKVFYLVSAAHGFDADLVRDVVSAFKINPPEEITDIAWEMAYTGLAYWDFDAKTYKIVPELRDRIVKYMEYERRDDYSLVLETIANSYLLRAEILSDGETQTVRFMKYLIASRRLQGISPKAIVKEINERINKLLKTTEDYTRLSVAIHQDKNEESLLKEILYSFEGSGLETTSLQENRGDAMRDARPHKLKVENSSMSRQEIQDYLKRFVKGEVKDKWVFHIKAEGGMGKTYMLSALKTFLKSENLNFAQVDLHIPECRNTYFILRQIANQTGVDRLTEVIDAFAVLEKEIEKVVAQESPFSAESSKEQFDRPYISVIDAIGDAFGKLSARPIVLIDTFDEGAIGLTKWFIPKLMSKLSMTSYFVVGGRLSAAEYAKPELNSGVIYVELGPLDREGIQAIVDERYPKKFDDETVNGVAKISEGNPLVVLWILLYLAKFENRDKWHDLIVTHQSQEQIFEHIAGKVWAEPKDQMRLVSTDGESRMSEGEVKARRAALRAAAHFGSHFNYDLFSKAVPSTELEGVTHKDAFNALRGEFIYVRGAEGDSHWTLHDKVREWLIEFIQKQSLRKPAAFSEKYSKNALVDYYSPLIKELENETNRSAEKQDRLDALKAEEFYHRLLVNTQPGDKPLQHHKDLWNYLDDLWDHYRHDQMAQVLRFVEELGGWKEKDSKGWEFVKMDLLLKDIWNAANAWLSYSQTDFDEARTRADSVRKSNSPHRRLKATASVVLGLLPTAKQNDAFDYLNSARHNYEELIGELEKGRTLNDQFTDDLDRIYPELHLVLLSIGRTHLRYFVELEKGIEALQEAFRNSRKQQWKKPVYSALALNEWARILRFQGDYSDALNKVMVAIMIYKKALENPRRFANYGYFYETLGLIYKELSEFEHAMKAFNTAQEIYKTIPNILDTRKATITLEIGEVYVLETQYDDAITPLEEAYKIFKKDISKNPWYYLSALNKLGRYYRATKQIEKAKEYYNEQINIAKYYEHRLWQYWAELSLAEIDYEENPAEFEKTRLENLLESSRNRFEFGPAFWRTKKLLYRITKERDKDSFSAITHLTEGLTYLAEHWRALFWENLVILRNELLEIDVKTLEGELIRIMGVWRRELPEGDSTHPFLQMCETLQDSVK